MIMNLETLCQRHRLKTVSMLILIICAVVIPGFSLAAEGSKVFEVLPSNAHKQHVGFHVIVTADELLGLGGNSMRRFTIEVSGHNQPLLAQCHADVSIYNDRELIALIEIAPKYAEKNKWTYILDIGGKYLGSETAFTFGAVRPAGDDGSTTTDFYRLVLKRFIEQ
jgi:hypothetical protein